MRNSIIFLFIAVSFSCLAGVNKIPEDRLYERVLQAIEHTKANDLTFSDYDNILEYLSSGESRWLALYPKLGKEPFSGVTYFQEGLDISMSYALANNAPETLKYINADNFDKICGIPFIEPTNEEVKAHYLKARKSLESCRHKNDKAASCLLNLEHVYSK